MDNGNDTHTYTKEELIECTLAFNRMSVKLIEPPFVSKITAILAIDEFKTEFRKIVPNTLWKG